jgi:cation transport ATPase
MGATGEADARIATNRCVNAMRDILGIEVRPEWSALLMSISSIIVATNAVLLKRVEHRLPRTAPA